MAVFVVHNKLKEKRGKIPEGVAYFPGANIADRWVDVSAPSLGSSRSLSLLSHRPGADRLHLIPRDAG